MLFRLLCCVLTLSLTTTDALSLSWIEQSSDGHTACNYTFKYDVNENIVGDEVTSDSFQCGSKTNTCTYTVNMDKAFTVQYSGLDNLTNEVSSKFLDNLHKIAEKLQPNYTQPRVKVGTFSCNINPGYQVKIILKPKFHVLSSHFKVHCVPLTYTQGNYSLIRNSVEVRIPVKSGLDEGIAGTVSCNVEPAADVQGMTKLCSSKKLTTGKMFDAVGETLYKAMVNTASNRLKTIEHTQIEGHQAWSLGMCWNNLSQDYCKVCLRHLIDNVWSECDNAEGAQLWVNDCGLRYERYPLNESSFDESFTGKHLNTIKL